MHPSTALSYIRIFSLYCCMCIIHLIRVAHHRGATIIISFFCSTFMHSFCHSLLPHRSFLLIYTTIQAALGFACNPGCKFPSDPALILCTQLLNHVFVIYVVTRDLRARSTRTLCTPIVLIRTTKK